MYEGKEPIYVPYEASTACCVSVVDLINNSFCSDTRTVVNSALQPVRLEGTQPPCV